MSYADPSDLACRFDEQTLKDIASDTGEPVADITGDTNILAALEDASGEVDAALQVAKTYSAADLAALTGNSLGLLKRIVCEKAMVFLLARRPEKFASDFFEAMYKRSEDYLERIRSGTRVFDVDNNKDAGLPTLDGPHTVDWQNLNLITARTRNFYPNYKERLPLGR